MMGLFFFFFSFCYGKYFVIAKTEIYNEAQNMAEVATNTSTSDSKLA